MLAAKKSEYLKLRVTSKPFPIYSHSKIATNILLILLCTSSYRTLLPIKLTLSPRLKSVAVNRERNTTGFGYRQIPRLGFEPIYNKTDD